MEGLVCCSAPEKGGEGRGLTVDGPNDSAEVVAVDTRGVGASFDGLANNPIG